MMDTDFLNPPIEVAGASPRIDMIKSRLRTAGMRPYDMRDTANDADPILLDIQSASKAQLVQIRQQAACGVERPFILLAPKASIQIQDAIILHHESELDSVPARITALARKRDRFKEARLRAKTAEHIAGLPAPAPQNAKPHILYVGNGSARFLAIQAELKAAQIDVAAALTLLTAGDYARDSNISSILVDLDECANLAQDFLRTFGEDHLMLGVPVFVIAHPHRMASAASRRVLPIATEIVMANQPMSDISDTLIRLAFQHKTATPLPPKLFQHHNIRDRTTGLFTGNFLEAHLTHQIQDTEQTMQPLTFVTLQLRSANDGNATARAQLPDVADFLAKKMRQTDCAGRLDWETLGISLRGTSYAGAVKMVERLTDTFEANALQKGGLAWPSNMTLSWRVVEKRRYHKASNLIATGKTGPQTRVFKAA